MTIIDAYYPNILFSSIVIKVKNKNYIKNTNTENKKFKTYDSNFSIKYMENKCQYFDKKI